MRSYILGVNNWTCEVRSLFMTEGSILIHTKEFWKKEESSRTKKEKERGAKQKKKKEQIK